MERDQSKFYDSKVTYDFNSHAHVERDLTVRVLSMSFDNFNSHAHVERDKEWNTEKKDITDFNSNAHVERDIERG